MADDTTAEPQVKDPNKAAAHYFLSELRTRISTQPLPYQHGDEDRALASLWEVFGQAREAMKKYPGCNKFADAVTEMLNLKLRPITAKWHGAAIEGRLKSRDGADEFRGDLAKAQEDLRKFAKVLHKMAYDEEAVDDLSPDVISKDDLKSYFAEVACGIKQIELTGSESPDIKRQIDRLNAQFAAINDAERAAIKTRRVHFGLPHQPNPATPERSAIGLALSGGGIRSATFCLGVVQLLAKFGLFKDIDFLSTVSGGGYAGCFITTRLGAANEETTKSWQEPENGNPREEPSGEQRSKPAETEKLRVEATKRQEAIAGPDGPDPLAIRYLRLHAKYLAALNLKQAWLMVTGTLAGMLYNWMAPLSVIIFAAAFVSAFSWLDPHIFEWRRFSLILMLALSALALLAYGANLSTGSKRAGAAGNILAILLAITAAVGAFWLLHAGYYRAIGAPEWVSKQWASKSWALSGVVAALVTASPAIIRFVPVVKNPKVRKIALQVLLWLAAVIVPLAAIVLFYILVHLGNDSDWIRALLFAAATTCAVLTLFFLNINVTGPHRLYRNQLARTFIQTDEADDAAVVLSGINPSGLAPYHLINTTLNVPNSESVALRERKSDFFLFSREYCGAPAVGYFKTPDWRTNAQPPDLATAMAISGAAASSWMGLGSMPTLTALLTFLNVRLGFWIRQPDKHKNSESPADSGRATTLLWLMRKKLGFSTGQRGARSYAGFLCLMREMFGFSMSEKDAWLNLSDGGHIENLGIYELLRRRCKMIVSVDGEADPAYTFHGLMTVVRHAQIDFGVRVEVDLSDIRPDPKTGYSQAHAALCTVHYPPDDDNPEGALGFIIYMKLSVTGNESEMIRRYRINHSDFPHQTTLDQFFDEEQFEAYRQLGVHVARGLFLPALMNPGESDQGQIDRDDRQDKIDSVQTWFERLVKNLLPRPIADAPAATP